MILATSLPLFGRDHLAALALTLLASVVLSVALRHARARGVEWPRPAVCRGLAALLLMYVVASQLWPLLQGRWTVQHNLPLHLCNLSALAAMAALLLSARPRAADAAARESGERNAPAVSPSAPASPAPIDARQVCSELTWFWALGGTTHALITPEIHDPFPSLEYALFFIGHGAVIVAAAVLTFGLRQRPRPGAFGRVWLITAAAAACVFVVNQLTGGNYMYLSRPPARGSLFDYFGQWPLSLVTLLLAGTVILAACAAPFWLADSGRGGMRQAR